MPVKRKRATRKKKTTSVATRFRARAAAKGVKVPKGYSIVKRKRTTKKKK